MTTRTLSERRTGVGMTTDKDVKGEKDEERLFITITVNEGDLG